MVEVNTEHIKANKSFKTGLFASYHVYPYYPEFMNYQKEYKSFIDKNGKINTYRAYLKDLIKEHTVPVLVAEFGVPAARGMAHVNIHTGYNQGNLDEKQQGEMDADMLKNIYEEGYAGGLVFTWQDEWFKRTWNTMDFDEPDRRPFWSNPQTNEQQFGMLAFDPGQSESTCYVDGEISDWTGELPLNEEKDIKLYVKSDEKYVYFMAETSGYDFKRDALIIPVDTIQGQGNNSFKQYNSIFSRDVDFVIVIDGKENSRILVDSYYDPYYFIYAKLLKMIDQHKEYESKGNGIFNKINLCLNRELFLPEDKVVLPFSLYETGKLVMGNANPKSAEFNSLVDFSKKDGIIEIRVPWQLFNVMDPSTKSIMGDLYKNKGIKAEKIDEIYVGAGIYHKDSRPVEIGVDSYTWQNWENPTFHERLKPSYYIMKKAFEEIGK